MLDSAISLGVCRRSYDEDSARHRKSPHRERKPWWCLPRTRVDRRAVERTVDFRNGRFHLKSRSSTRLRAVLLQRGALRGMAGGDCAVVDAEAEFSWAKRAQRDAAAGAAAASRDCVRRAYQGGVQPGGAPREGMVRDSTGPRRTAKCVEGLRGAPEGANRRFEHVEISITPSSASEGHKRHCEALRRSRCEPADPPQCGADEAALLEGVRDVGRATGKV